MSAAEKCAQARQSICFSLFLSLLVDVQSAVDLLGCRDMTNPGDAEALIATVTDLVKSGEFLKKLTSGTCEFLPPAGCKVH